MINFSLKIISTLKINIFYNNLFYIKRLIKILKQFLTYDQIGPTENDKGMTYAHWLNGGCGFKDLVYLSSVMTTLPFQLLFFFSVPMHLFTDKHDNEHGLIGRYWTLFPHLHLEAKN